MYPLKNKTYSRRLLIIDPDTEIIAILTPFLEEKGIAVSGVSSSGQLNSTLLDYQPHALLVDYSPMRSNSLQMWSQIKTDPISAPLPTVVYSTSPALQQLQLELGCKRIVSKPFDLDALEASILDCF